MNRNEFGYAVAKGEADSELRSLAEACETTANHYQTQAALGDVLDLPRREFWGAKAQHFEDLAKNIREILAEESN